MITFRRLSHRSSYNKRSSINSVSDNGCSAGSGYRLYGRCRGRSSSNKSKSGGRWRRRRSRILTARIILAETVAGSLGGS